MRHREYKLPARLWAGIVDGKMDLDPYPDQLGGHYGTLYKTKREAQKFYEEVVRVEVKRVSK